MNFPSQTNPEFLTTAACTEQNKSISKLSKSKKALVSSQKSIASKEDPAEERLGDCDPSKMNSTIAKNTKKSKQEPQTKRKLSGGLLNLSKAESSRKMELGNISSKEANSCSPSSKEAYISGETKHKPANPRKLKMARPTFSKQVLKIKDEKNPSTALLTINNENYNNGDKETAKRDG